MLLPAENPMTMPARAGDAAMAWAHAMCQPAP